jgi:hypothetical protein
MYFEWTVIFVCYVILCSVAIVLFDIGCYWILLVVLLDYEFGFVVCNDP